MLQQRRSCMVSYVSLDMPFENFLTINRLFHEPEEHWCKSPRPLLGHSTESRAGQGSVGALQLPRSW